MRLVVGATLVAMGLGFLPVQTAAALSGGDSYTAVTTPCRILDTRQTGPTGGAPLTAQQTLTIAVTGHFACATVPSTASAVVMNTTATAPTNSGYLALYPSGAPNSTSNLNFGSGDTVANLTTIQVGAGGAVTILDGQPNGTVHVIIDLEGYYAPPGTTTAGQYVSLAPTRIVDTRNGSGCTSAGDTLGPNGTLIVQVMGSMSCTGSPTGVPNVGVSAVVFNLTATNTSAGTYLAAFEPTPAGHPLASNVNIRPDETRSNRVIVSAGVGQVAIFNAAGTADVIIDVTGYYTDKLVSGAVGSLFTPIAPRRFEDTRTDGNTLGSMGTLTVPVAGTQGIPANAVAVVENTTEVNATQTGFFTMYPGGPLPATSDLVFSRGAINPNLVQAALSGTGSETIFNCCGSADAVIDVFGYFVPATVAPTTPVPYSVSGPSPSATPVFSTSASPSQGQVTYSVDGLNSSNTPSGHVDIALFPSTGPDAPAQNGGIWTFTSSAGQGQPGAAAGEATSNNGFAYISSVEGIATSSEPGLVKDVSVMSTGTVTFTLNSFMPDGAVPVVFSEPAAADTGTLQLQANGQPSSAYPFGVGNPVIWQQPPAAGGTYTDWVVQSVNNAGNTFSACDQAKSQCFTFNDGVAGDTFAYANPANPLSLSDFQSALTGPVTQKDGLPSPVPGDELTIEYNTAGSSMFAFSRSLAASMPGSGSPAGQADVPGPPPWLAATSSIVGGTGEVQLDWSAPTNLDVVGDTSAVYQVYRALVTGGTPGPFARIGSIGGSTLATSGVQPCSNMSRTCVVDTSASTGNAYDYAVSAVSGTGNGSLATEGPASIPAYISWPAG